MKYEFDEFGRLKPMTPEELAAADAGPWIIVLDRGVTPDKRPYWAYVAIKPSKYKEFMRIAKSGKSKVFTDYGKILKYGYAEEVPERIKEKMRQEYNCDENSEAIMKKELEQARLIFLKQQEAKNTNRISEIVARILQKKST